MDRKAPEILVVKDVSGDERFDIHPNLPEMPSLCLILGSIKSGKSNLIVNFFCNDEFYKDKFDIVRLMSTTLHMDNKMKIMNDHFDCDDHYQDSYIDDIMKSQGGYEKDDPERPKYCLVLDDILSPEFCKKNNKLAYFTAKMRHFIDMMIISSQSLNNIPPIIRGQVRDLIITRQQNGKELEKISEQFGGLLGSETVDGTKKFSELYRQVHSKPYQIMYIKASENPVWVFENFNKRIY